jgi:hypothetical protein
MAHMCVRSHFFDLLLYPRTNEDFERRAPLLDEYNLHVQFLQVNHLIIIACEAMSASV